MNELILELKNEIIEALNLDLTPDQIDDDAPLFGDGLGLDSIDALELVVILEKYGIQIKTEEEGKQAFTSVRALAQYVHEHRK
jgi:acyl carrier protein